MLRKSTLFQFDPYFFNCTFGVSLTAGGQYFDNKGSLMSYHLVAMPVMAGLRFRF
jgi:hypothetical protein